MLPKLAPPTASGNTEVSAVNVLVLIPEVPLSIAPKPLVMEPVSNAPTAVIFGCDAVCNVPANCVALSLPVLGL